MIIKWHRRPMAYGVVAMIFKRRRFKQATELGRRLAAAAESRDLRRNIAPAVQHNLGLF